MRLLIDDATKNVIRAYYAAETFAREPDSWSGISVLDIDEIAAAKGLCKDLHVSVGKEDANGLTKYYIDQDGDLAERDGWVEAPPEEL